MNTNNKNGNALKNFDDDKSELIAAIGASIGLDLKTLDYFYSIKKSTQYEKSKIGYNSGDSIQFTNTPTIIYDFLGLADLKIGEVENGKWTAEISYKTEMGVYIEQHFFGKEPTVEDVELVMAAEELLVELTANQFGNGQKAEIFFKCKECGEYRHWLDSLEHTKEHTKTSLEHFRKLEHKLRNQTCCKTDTSHK